MQAERGDRSRITMAIDAEDAAFLVKLVVIHWVSLSALIQGRIEKVSGLLVGILLAYFAFWLLVEELLDRFLKILRQGVDNVLTNGYQHRL